MRKKIVSPDALDPTTAVTGELDIARIATVLVTSEDPSHPVENAFDGQRGPGASYWAAAEPGLQTIVLVFDRPQSIRKIQIEIEETAASRAQTLQVLVSQNGGRSFEQTRRQEYNFSPAGATFQQEIWEVDLRDVTHFRLEIAPDADRGVAPAKLTALTLAA